MELYIGQFPSQTGQQIFYRIWEPTIQAKGVVQILHGMAEHSHRYNDFAEFLCSKGYIVAANDHAGHGKTAEDSGIYGYFDEKFGWDKVIEDVLRFNKQLRDEYKLPIIILGHSMGSFLARSLMIQHPQIAKKWILTGTANATIPERWGGAFLANISLFFSKPDSPSSWMHNLSFGSFNKRFKADKSENAWICSDKEIVKIYDQDKYCGGIFSGAFYRDLMYGINLIHSRKQLKRIPKNTKIYLFSGANDPVGNFSKGVKKVHRRFLRYELDSHIKIYPKMRHEILNESDNTIVYQDILNCINK